MCFDLLWNSGFLVSFNAELLSMYSGTVSMYTAGIRRSLIKLRIHTASFAASAAALYSASIVDVATIFCLCDDQDTGPPASVNTHPVVDLRESSHPAKLLSTNPVSWRPCLHE